MGQILRADLLVNAPSANIDRYKCNFLRQAVCELRFPMLMELGEARPPAAFVSALRKEYPHVELANEVTLGIGTTPGANHAHIFRSSKLNWTVSLKQSALTVETTTYTEYEQLRDRVLKVVKAAQEVIETDFFTRIGLRYVNVLDPESDPADGWVNSSLVQPILSQKFTGVKEHAGRLHLGAEDGGCLLQHGIRLKPPARDDKEQFPEYLIDIDAYRTDVLLSDVGVTLDTMHAQVFDLFDWCLGDKAREHLSKTEK